MNRITDGVKNLIIINVIFFIAKVTLENKSAGLGLFMKKLGLFFPKSDFFEPYQFITHFFMHADMQHLVFNMLMLFFLGPMVEQAIGTKKFLILYFASAVAAFVFHFGVDVFRYYQILGSEGMDNVNMVIKEGYEVLQRRKNYTNENLGTLNLMLNQPVVGASGAIFGVTAAFGALFPNAKLMLLIPPMPVKGKYLALIAIGMGILLDFKGNVAHLAHIGGALVGYLFIVFYINRKR